MCQIFGLFLLLDISNISIFPLDVDNHVYLLILEEQNSSKI